jgi:hypothetical protein
VDENIVTWNVTNWVTVVIMVGIGFALIGWGQSVWAKRQAA